MVTTLGVTETEKLFENFVAHQVPTMYELLENPDDISFFCCNFSQPKELSRRVLVVADASSPTVRVCIEAAYELFEGDINYKVERVGEIYRRQVRQELINLLQTAYARLISWRPTQENIWD